MHIDMHMMVTRHTMFCSYRFMHIMIHDLTDAKRREWIGMGVAGIIIDSYCGLFSHSLRLSPVSDISMIYPLVI